MKKIFPLMQVLGAVVIFFGISLIRKDKLLVLENMNLSEIASKR